MLAFVETTLQNVRLEMTVPAGATRLHLFRQGPSGVAGDVRGYADAATSPGLLIARDYEAAIGVPLTYTAEHRGTTGNLVLAETVTVTIPSQGCRDTWLTDLARTQNTMRIEIETLPELSYPVPTSVHEVITRRAPIVSSDVAHTPAFELTFLTADAGERDRARAVLGNGVPVLLRSPPEVGIENMYVSVLGFAEQRITASGMLQDRRFVVQAREVDRPVPALYAPSSPSTYKDVRDNYATYGALKAARSTYDAVLYDWTGEDPSDIVPWPPDDA